MLETRKHVIRKNRMDTITSLKLNEIKVFINPLSTSQKLYTSYDAEYNNFNFIHSKLIAFIT